MTVNSLPIHMHINYDRRIRYFEYRPYNHVFVEKSKDFVEASGQPILDLTSEKNKILVGLHPRIYHCLVDNLAEILYLDNYFKSSKVWKDFEFILDSSGIPSNHYENNSLTFFNFLFKVLKDKNIDFNLIHSAPTKLEAYSLVDTIVYPKKSVFIKIDNCAVFKESSRHYKFDNFNTLSELYKDYSQQSFPNKIVYLSRNFKNVDYPITERYNNEILIEKFFKDQGCEIVIPEMFKTFEEQINYFSSVKTLVALTGSGLLNMLMMKNGSNVVEIYTPIETASYNSGTNSRLRQISTHSLYRDVGWSKDHNYMSIKNEYKSDTIELINKLENNSLLRSILKDDYEKKY